MAYSEDLKRRVLAYVAQGGNKAQAARLFSLARSTLYAWLGQPANHQRRKPGPKAGHKIDRDKLTALIEEQPDLLQREMAQIMGVGPKSISHALKAMRITRKKNAALRTSVHPGRRAQAQKIPAASLAGTQPGLPAGAPG
jgi:transposase-like protein